MPVGWAVATAPDGRLFYVDHTTRTTHLELPEGLRVVGDPDKAPPVGDDPGTDGETEFVRAFAKFFAQFMHD